MQKKFRLKVNCTKCYIFTWHHILLFPCSRHNSLPQWLPWRSKWNLFCGWSGWGSQEIGSDHLWMSYASHWLWWVWKQMQKNTKFNRPISLKWCSVQCTVFVRCTLVTFRGQTCTVGCPCCDLKKIVSVLCLVKPGIRYRELGNIIQKHAQANGFSVVRSYCGHGIHKLFHTAPNVPHYASE